jgi:transcriptional regulator with XRE-family HTH domain
MQPSREEWYAWEQSTLRALAVGVREARERSGMSQRALAEAAGVDRGQIANLESSANSDSASRTTELPRLGLIVRLALALRIPPLELLYPDLADGPAEVWPGTTTTSFEAAQWFSGELLASDIKDDEMTSGSTNEKIRLSRAKRSAQRQLREAVNVLTNAQWTPSNSAVTPELAEQVITSHKQRLRDIVDLMKRLGMTIKDA